MQAIGVKPPMGNRNIRLAQFNQFAAPADDAGVAFSFIIERRLQGGIMPTRAPPFLKRLAAPGAEAFATLYALESLSRAILATVLPLQALRLTGDAQGVSTTFFAASLVALFGGLAVPWVVRLTARRWVYSLGAVFLAAASFFLAGESLTGFVLGMVLRALAIAVMAICLSLYIMDFVARKDFGRSEPMRLFYSAGAWSAGPFLGVYLAEAIDPWVPYALSAVMAIAALGYFWFLRISENPAVKQASGPTPSPLRYVPRYFSQPRLSLAWVLSTGRNFWWVVFFIYAPIYAVEAGLGEVAGGAIVSCGTAFLFLMPALGRLVQRAGIRNVFLFGYATGGILTLGLLAAWDVPWIGACFLISAALGMVTVDAAGNVLFMLAVRPRERPEMTAVYSTYRDVADIAPPGMFSVILKFFELPSVFVVSGLAALGLALISGKIHRRLGKDMAAMGRAHITSAPNI